MPSSGRACRSESERSNGSLGTIFLARPAFARHPVTVFLFWSRYSGCVWTRQCRKLILDRRIGFDFGRRWVPIRWVPILVPPGEFFLTSFEAGEVAAAGNTTVRSGAEAQLQSDPARRAVVLFAPGGKLLAIALRAAGVFPGGGFPGASGPAGIATAATQRANPDQTFEPLGHASAVGHTGITRAALRTRQFHFPRPGSIIDRIGAEFNVLIYVRGERLAEAIAHGATALNRQALDVDDREQLAGGGSDEDFACGTEIGGQ